MSQIYKLVSIIKHVDLKLGPDLRAVRYKDVSGTAFNPLARIFNNKIAVKPLPTGIRIEYVFSRSTCKNIVLTGARPSHPLA